VTYVAITLLFERARHILGAWEACACAGAAGAIGAEFAHTNISSLLPPNLSIIGHQGGYGMSEQTTQTCFLGDVFVDGEWGNEEFFHEEPEFWVSAHDLYVPLEWRPYAGEGTKGLTTC
jgi:hypothetical protein